MKYLDILLCLVLLFLAERTLAHRAISETVLSTKERDELEARPRRKRAQMRIPSAKLSANWYGKVRVRPCTRVLKAA